MSAPTARTSRHPHLSGAPPPCPAPCAVPGLQESDIGINPNNDGERIRLIMPPMTQVRARVAAVMVVAMSVEVLVRSDDGDGDGDGHGVLVSPHATRPATTKRESPWQRLCPGPHLRPPPPYRSSPPSPASTHPTPASPAAGPPQGPREAGGWSMGRGRGHVAVLCMRRCTADDAVS